MPNNPYFYDLLDGDGEQCAHYLFNGRLSVQHTDKPSNKVHFERRGPAEAVVLWLECTFKRTCVFFQAAIKVEKPSLQMLFYVAIVRRMTGVSLCQHRCRSLRHSLEYDRGINHF